MTPEIREFLKEPKLLIITKAARALARAPARASGLYRRQALRPRRQAGRRMRILRAVHLDRLHALGARHSLSAAQGRQRHQPRRLRSGRAIPARRWSTCWRHYPRDELFQIDEDTLYQFALAILQLDERPRVRVLPRRDRFDRFVSVLVFIPRDRYDSHGSGRTIGDYLATRVQRARLRAFYPFFPEGPLVRVHFIIGRYEGETPNVDRATLERAVEAHRAQLDRRPRRGARARARPAARRARCSRAIARPSRSTIARSIRRRWRVADIARASRR